jgi:hypothetical protein
MVPPSRAGAARDPAGEWAVTRRRLTWLAFLSCRWCVVCVAREGRVLTGSGGRCLSGVRGAASDGTAAGRAWLLLLRSSSGYLGHCLAKEMKFNSSISESLSLELCLILHQIYVSCTQGVQVCRDVRPRTKLSPSVPVCTLLIKFPRTPYRSKSEIYRHPATSSAL